MQCFGFYNEIDGVNHKIDILKAHIVFFNLLL